MVIFLSKTYRNIGQRQLLSILEINDYNMLEGFVNYFIKVNGQRPDTDACQIVRNGRLAFLPAFLSQQLHDVDFWQKLQKNDFPSTIGPRHRHKYTADWPVSCSGSIRANTC